MTIIFIDRMYTVRKYARDQHFQNKKKNLIQRDKTFIFLKMFPPPRKSCRNYGICRWFFTLQGKGVKDTRDSHKKRYIGELIVKCITSTCTDEIREANFKPRSHDDS